MKAHGVLVQAALKLGMSRVPGDTSEIFNKQYEGLIEYNKAKQKTIGQAVKARGQIAMGVEQLMKKEEVDPLTQQQKFPQNYNPDGTPKTVADVEKEHELKKKKSEDISKFLRGEKSDYTGFQPSAYLEQQRRLHNVPKFSQSLMSKEIETNDVDSDASGDSDSPVEYSPFKAVEEKPAKTSTSNIKKQTNTSVETTGLPEEELPTTNEMNSAIESMVTDLAVESITQNTDHYNGGGGMSEAHFDAADLAFRDLKQGIYTLINQKNPTLEDKKLQNKLQRKTNVLKQNVVGTKGLVRQTAQAYSEDLINSELSFKGKPNEQILLKQIMDPKADLQTLGISAFWKDEELHYEYGPSQIFMEYANNKGLQINPEEIMVQERNVISASDLLGMAVLKDTKSENDINSVIAKAGDDAIATIENTKNLLHKDFSRVENDVETGFRSILENSKANLQDLFTRDLTIGNSKRNYKKDLEINPEINALTYSGLGLTASVDENQDGVISNDELTNEDKAIIIETLTNPQTSEQKKAAIDTFVNTYLKPLASQEFDYMRGQSGKAGNYTTSGMTPQEIIKKFS